MSCRMSKRRAIWCIAVIANMLLASLFVGVHPTEGGGPPVTSLQSSVFERVTITDNGEAEVNIIINVTSPELAEMYRNVLYPPAGTGVEEEIDIPQWGEASIDIELGEGVTTVGEPETSVTYVPVRNQFCRSVFEEQELLFGLRAANVTDATMVPRAANGGCRIYLQAHAVPHILSPSQSGVNYTWFVAVGPCDEDTVSKAMGHILGTTMYTKDLLNSLPGEQVYERQWTTKIVLPAHAHIMNTNQLQSCQWQETFDDDSHISATVQTQSSSTTVSDYLYITEKNMSDPGELVQGYMGYKSFVVECETLHPAAHATPINGTEFKMVGGLFPFTYTVTFVPWSLNLNIPIDFPIPFIPGVYLVGNIDVGSRAEIGASIEGTVIPFHVECTDFHAWIEAHASFKAGVKLELTYPLFGIDFTQEIVIFTGKASFMVGIIPVWIDFTGKFTIELSITVSVEVDWYIGYHYMETYKYGVRYDGTNWHKIDEKTKDEGYDLQHLKVKLKVVAELEGSVSFSVLLYGIIGPYVAAVLRLTVTVQMVFDFNITIGNVTIDIDLDIWVNLTLEINIGIEFAGSLKWLLDKCGVDTDGITYTIFDITWSLAVGHWNLTDPRADTADPSVVRGYTTRVGRSTSPDREVIGTDTSITLIASDNQGINWTKYRYYNNDYNSGWVTYTGSFRITRPGTYTLEYQSMDYNGNTDTKSCIIQVVVSFVQSFLQFQGASYDDGANHTYVNSTTGLDFYSFWPYGPYVIYYYVFDGIGGTIPYSPWLYYYTLQVLDLFPYGWDGYQKLTLYLDYDFFNAYPEGEHTIEWFAYAGSPILGFLEGQPASDAITNTKSVIVDTIPPVTTKVEPWPYYAINSTAGYLRPGDAVTLSGEDINPINMTWASGLNWFAWGFHQGGIWHPHDQDDSYDNNSAGPFNRTLNDNRFWYFFNATKGIRFFDEDRYDVQYFGMDNVRNSNLEIHTYYIDGTPPSTTSNVGTPYYTDGKDEWITSTTNITLTAVDGGVYPCGVNTTYYQYGGSGWQTYGMPFSLPDEGTFSVDYYSEDHLGNTEPINSRLFHVDNTPPISKLKVDEDPFGYVSPAATFTITALDQGGDHPVDYCKIHYKINGKDMGIHNSPTGFQLNELYGFGPGIYKIKYWGFDALGNEESIHHTATYIVDATAPHTAFEFDGPHEWARTHWKISTETGINLTASDSGCGVRATYYKINYGNWTRYNGTFMLETPSYYHLIYYSEDWVGNRENPVLKIIEVGGVLPMTTCSLDPVHPDGDHDWYISAVTVTLTAVDDISGVDTIFYAIDENNWQEYTGPISIETDGVHTLSYYSVDNAANIENTQFKTINIDKVAPIISFEQPRYGYLYILGREILLLPKTVIFGKVTFNVDTSDGISGISRAEIYINDVLKATLTGEPFEWLWDERMLFNHIITAVAYDTAGNMAAVEQEVWMFNI